MMLVVREPKATMNHVHTRKLPNLQPVLFLLRPKNKTTDFENELQIRRPNQAAKIHNSTKPIQFYDHSGTSTRVFPRLIHALCPLACATQNVLEASLSLDPHYK